jgi:iron complex transport system substrate-binding protein
VLVERLPVLNTVSIDTSALSSRQIDAAASSSGHADTSLYHVDPDLLRSLRPELILTQTTCEVCAVSRRDVDLATRTLGYVPRVLSLNPASLDHVLEDIALIAAEAGVPERSAPAIAHLRQRLDAVRARAAGVARPRVFCMEWLDPPFSAGHWVPEMVELAGGCDELGTPAGPSRRIDWSEVTAYAPAVIVLMPCSLELERVAAEFPLLRALPGWSELPAVKSGQLFAGNTHLFSRSGPRLVDGVETLARMLHPSVFEQPLPAGFALKVAPDGQRLEPFA